MNRLFFTLITGDTVCAYLAVFCAYVIRFAEIPSLLEFTGSGEVRAALFVLVMLFSSFFVEIYTHDKELEARELAARIGVSFILSFFVLSTVYYMVPSVMYGRGVLVIALICFCILQFAWHQMRRLGLLFPGFAKRVLILGTGPLAREMGGLISQANGAYVLSGYVACTDEPVYVPTHSIVGDKASLWDTVKRERAEKIVVSLTERRGVFPLQDMLACKLSGVEVMDAPSFYEKVTGKLLIESINPSWMIFSHGFRVTALLRVIKRMVDVCCAFVGSMIVLPFVPFVALVIKLDSPGPVLFSQERVGEGERRFFLYKFRTMRQDAESGTGAVWAQKDDPRVTRIGRFLRKTRIDEIPQLFNVLRGDMSLVGPRPERPEFVAKLKEVIPYYSERHFVKPGVTGWAQVRYPYGASVEDAIEKLRFDLYYIKNFSVALDIIILIETVKVVLFGRGGR